MRRTAAALLLVAALVVAATACGSDSTSAGTPAGSSTTVDAPTGTTLPVVREILDDLVDPPGAPGNTLTLARYTIAPGAKLAPHVHPGLQMASIDAGTLTYTVVSGTAQVRRSGSTTDEPVTGPATIELGPGDAVVEVGDMVHFGANEGDVPVIILATLLTQDGHDLAETVTTDTTTG